MINCFEPLDLIQSQFVGILESLKDFEAIVFQEKQAKKFLLYLDEIKFCLRIKHNEMSEFFDIPIKPIPGVRQQKVANKLCNPLQRYVNGRKAKEVSLQQLSKEVGKLKCIALKRNDTAVDERKKKGKDNSPSFFQKKCTIKEIIDRIALKARNIRKEMFCFELQKKTC